MIYQRSDGLWVARISLPNGKRKSKYSLKQKVVKDCLLEKRKQALDGTLADDKELTFSEFLECWLEDVKVPLLSPSTIATHKSIIRNHIKPSISAIRLSQITPAHLSTLYAEKLRSGLSKRTVIYIHTIIHQTLNQALKWGLVARNVATAVNAPTPDKKLIEQLNQD